MDLTGRVVKFNGMLSEFSSVYTLSAKDSDEVLLVNKGDEFVVMYFIGRSAVLRPLDSYRLWLSSINSTSNLFDLLDENYLRDYNLNKVLHR